MVVRVDIKLDLIFRIIYTLLSSDIQAENWKLEKGQVRRCTTRMSFFQDEVPLRKKAFRKSQRSVGLPFPNFGLGKTELPIICRCYCTFVEEEDNGSAIDNTELTSSKGKIMFYVKHQIDMLTLYINGSFGTSSSTHRSPSFLSDVPFEQQMYYQKLKEREKQQSTSAGNNCDSNTKPVETNGIADSEDKLLLLGEEVIFLSFGVGCLSLHNSSSENLTYQMVWEKLVKRNSEFPFLYAVYHYFRSKNWVPKAGIQFGGDYVLYKIGPEVHHATYVVHIIGLPSRPKPSWTELYAWQRVAAGSGKQALLCEITPPNNFTPETTTPRSIFEIQIKETVIERWDPFSVSASTSTRLS